MNNDLFMNDTLDNIHFSQDLIAKDVWTIKTTQNKPNAQPNLATDQTKEKEISFDDSIFLSGSLDNDVSNEKENTPSIPTKVDELSKVQNRKGIQSNEINKGAAFEEKYFSETHCKHTKDPEPPSMSGKKEKDSVPGQTSQFDFGNVCKLSSWGFPDEILQKYESKNLHKMFQWQVECLNKQDVLKNYKNLVYAAPTSAGKTLVAEILAIKTVLERKKKVIFILPFISIVQEKMYYFQDLLGSSGVRVEGFMGSYNPPGGFSSVQVAICTIEKANSLINRLLEEEKVSDVGAVLVDEIHMLGDPSRGYLLELLLTKLLYISKKDVNIKLQIIGMSATLPNLDQLAKWLNAELYTTDFRPIPLYELVHVCGEIYDKDLKLLRKLKQLEGIATDTDNILQLCLETIQESCSVLIFCPTKNWCESLAQQIAVSFCKLGNVKNQWGEVLRLQLNTNLIMEVLEQLKFCPVGLDDLLRRTVSFGVAFHHAGLTMDERDIIEGMIIHQNNSGKEIITDFSSNIIVNSVLDPHHLYILILERKVQYRPLAIVVIAELNSLCCTGAFRRGALRVLVATSTLSSGVNLPARRVIVRTAVFHQGRPIDPLTYRQMIGRAGRMGKDTMGESILVCQRNDYGIAKSLLSAPIRPVESYVDLFARCTLLAIMNERGAKTDEDADSEEGLENPIEEAVTFLKEHEFIRLQKQDDGTEKYAATSLGKACLSSSVAPDEGLALFTELDKARQCFVLETELHLIYLVTPYSACHSWGNLDWMFYLELWQKLPRSMKKVGELVGVRESYLISATRGKLRTDTTKSYHKLLVHKRFFVALALQDLVNEKPLGWVCAKFNCNRGLLQSLQQSASVFAGMVSSFSRQLGWSSVELLVSQFQDRLQFGVSRDLLDLMHLPILNGKIARTLYDAGIETVAQLANAKAAHVEDVLYKATPFETEKGKEGESEYAKKQRNKFRNVWVTGKEGLTEREAAEMLVNEARKYLKLEMGLVDAKWNDTSDADAESHEELTDRAKEHVEHQEPSTNQIEANGKSKQDKAGDIEKLNSEVPRDIEMSIQNVSSDGSLFGSETNISNSSLNSSSPNNRHTEEINNKNVEIDNQNMSNSSIRESPRITESKNANCNQNVSNETYVKDNFDSFSNVNLSEIEMVASSNVYRKESPPKRREVSDVLSSSSSRELNISNASGGSEKSAVSVTLHRAQSDESLFDSFSLHLSSSSSEEKNNPVEEMDTMAVLQNAFQNCSSDIFETSEDELDTKKRKNGSLEPWTPSKKLKGSEIESIPLRLSFAEDKFGEEDPVDFNRIEIVNVCDDSALFELFHCELKRQRSLSLSLACSGFAENKSTIGLGM
nr:unnamed protein product [Callosobruchus analis]